jgi:hypothetical protein
MKHLQISEKIVIIMDNKVTGIENNDVYHKENYAKFSDSD